MYRGMHVYIGSSEIEVFFLQSSDSCIDCFQFFVLFFNIHVLKMCSSTINLIILSFLPSYKSNNIPIYSYPVRDPEIH